MDSTHMSRRAPLRRVNSVAMIAAAIALGCGAKVVVDLDGGIVGVGGEGGATSSGGGGLGSDAGCGLGSTGVGAGQMQLAECFATPPSGCPNQYDAVLHIVPSTSCVYLVSVDCGPFITPDGCCYVVTEEQKACD